MAINELEDIEVDKRMLERGTTLCHMHRSVGHSHSLGDDSIHLLATKERALVFPLLTWKVDDHTDEFKLKQDAKKMPCKHIFHDMCVIPWLNKVRLLHPQPHITLILLTLLVAALYVSRVPT